MHFEILVEDSSGKVALNILMPKIVSNEKNTYRIISYKGIGHIPKGMAPKTDANKRILLDQLPRLLKGYGKTYAGSNNSAAVIIVCDLDNKNKHDFLTELKNILYSCSPAPTTCFCLAVEEGEAWMLGDIAAIRAAYPRAKNSILNSYINDSICGTWELLAEAVYPGGCTVLSNKRYAEIGTEKSKWAEKICPHMDINNNCSPSFNFFKDTIQKFAK